MRQVLTKSLPKLRQKREVNFDPKTIPKLFKNLSGVKSVQNFLDLDKYKVSRGSDLSGEICHTPVN